MFYRLFALLLASIQRRVSLRYRARTVHLYIELRPLELPLNEKQIPQVVGKNRNASRKWNARKELASLQRGAPQLSSPLSGDILNGTREYGFAEDGVQC
jgi:hypothetical protein